MKFNKEFLAALAYCHHFADKKDDHNHNATGICVEYSDESDDFNIVATDGCALAWYEKGTIEKPKRVVLPLDQVKVLLQKAKWNQSGEIEFDDDFCTIKLSHSSETFTFKHKGTDYVNWRRVLPRNDRAIGLTAPIGFNLEFFEKVSKGINSFKPFLTYTLKLKTVQFKFGNVSEALIVHVPTNDFTFNTLIMPCRLK